MEGKTKINLDEKENIVRKGINFSPNKHLAPCSMTQRKTNDTCIEHRECFEAEWENGCWSSHCLKDGKHYLSQINPENVVKNRCYFGNGTRLSVGDRSQLGQNSHLNGKRLFP